MTYEYKKILFSNFLMKWETQFNKVPFILRYLASYQEVAERLNGLHAMTIDELNESQRGWVFLITQNSNKIETDFFKDYWVPISKNGYDYFIDLSDERLPIFRLNFHFYEPYRWVKVDVINDLSQFFADMDNPKFSLENHFEQMDNEQWSKFSDLQRERDELGYAGMLKLDPIDREVIFGKKKKSSFTYQDNCITFYRVNSVIAGLLPYDCEITLERFRVPLNTRENACEKVGNIKALIYLFQSSGLLSVESYALTFNSDKSCRAYYENNTFVLIHNDKEIIKTLIDKCRNL